MISILLVDEEPAILEMTREFLEEAGDVRITSCMSVQEALGYLETMRFHAIVSDYDMPGMNGIDFLRILKSRGDDTPFIIFTGKGREQIAMEALNSGADFYLQKGGAPRAQFTELRNMVDKAVQERRAAQALRESERRFRDTLENIRMIAIQFDIDGNVTFCNRFLLEVTGWGREEVIGRNWFAQFVPEECRENLKAVMGAALVKAQVDLYHENPILTRSGERRDIAWNNTVLRDMDGNVTGVSSIGEDVTERKRAAAERAMLAAIVESSEDAIFGEDLDGKITSWNAGAARLYGYTAGEMIGEHVSMIVPEEERPAREERIGKILHGERPGHFESKRKRKDGEFVEVSVSVSPIFSQDSRVVGVANIARDLTKQRETEKTFIAYITEAALRLKNPIELMGARLADISGQIGCGETTDQEIRIQLMVQVRNIEQIIKNLNELNRVILEDHRNVPDAYREYLVK